MENRRLIRRQATLQFWDVILINPEIFGLLEKTKPGAGNEIQLTDALFDLAKMQDMYAYVFEGKRYDVGNKMGFLQATVEFALKRGDLHDDFAEYLKKYIKNIVRRVKCQNTKRVLKVSGEALAGEKGSGLDEKTIGDITDNIKKCRDLGVQIAIVCGGGNFWRGRTGKNMDRTRADHMGMLATVINALAFRTHLNSAACPRVFRRR